MAGLFISSRNHGVVSGTVAFTQTDTLSSQDYYFYKVAVADLDQEMDMTRTFVVSCQPLHKLGE